MIHPKQFKETIIDPTLRQLGLYSEAASNLLLGTAISESRLTYLKQLGGPALGVYQIEPATHNDVFENYLNYRKELRAKVLRNSTQSAIPQHQDLIRSLSYATAICRVIYLRRPETLPDPRDWEAMGEYWKQHYNTHLGRGTVEHFTSSIITAEKIYGALS